MLTQLSTIKQRLSLPDTDPQFDVLLTCAIAAVSARFDGECNRTLARTENFIQEFDPADTEILAACYPIEAVAKFELKSSEAEGWQEVQPTPAYLIRSSCIISLPQPFIIHPSSFILARVTYIGGYLLPGTAPSPPVPPATLLPPDLESAAIEQVAFWFQTRDKLGVQRQWPKGGTYEQFADLDLLPGVRAVLARHTRIVG